MIVDRAAVKSWLRLPPDITDDDLIDNSLAACLAWVSGLPVLQDLLDPADTTAWPADVQLGAVMLTARTYRRRNSAGGVESFGESVTYVSSFDPEIERLLRLDRKAAQAPPRVG